MPVSLQVVLGVVIAAALALILFRRPRQVPPPSVTAIPGDLTGRLQELVAADRKIQAIKELREHTGMSLLDAKNYVERMPPSGPVPPPEPPRGLSAVTQMRVRELVTAGRYVQAVKVIRDETGWPLKQSKDAVDRLRGG